MSSLFRLGTETRCLHNYNNLHLHSTCFFAVVCLIVFSIPQYITVYHSISQHTTWPLSTSQLVRSEPSGLKILKLARLTTDLHAVLDQVEGLHQQCGRHPGWGLGECMEMGGRRRRGCDMNCNMQVVSLQLLYDNLSGSTPYSLV